MQESDINKIIENFLAKFFAQTRYSSDTGPFRQQRFVIPLDSTDPTTGLPIGTVTNPFKIKMPVTSIRCEDATDNTAEIRVSLNADTTQQISNYTTVRKNDSIKFNTPASSLFLTWNSQSGKTITIICYVDVNFESGTQVSSIAGGVSISEGASYVTEKFDITALTAFELFPSDSDRKLGTWLNQNGTCYIGPTSLVSNTGTNKGEIINNGEELEWRNTAALWVYPMSSSTDEVKGVQK